MTLAELAALAAKVEGFERPAAVPCPCDGVGFCVRCLFSDDDDGWDNSPAALLMAVVQHSLEFHALEQDIVVVRACGAAGPMVSASSKPLARLTRTSPARLSWRCCERMGWRLPPQRPKPPHLSPRPLRHAHAVNPAPIDPLSPRPAPLANYAAVHRARDHEVGERVA